MVRRPWWILPLLIIIILLAVYLRTDELMRYPPGLFHDEAMNAIDGRDVIEHGYFPIYFERNTGGREALFIYAQTAAMFLFGQNVFALRYVPVIFGILTVAAIYPLGARLFDWRVGLLGSTMMATLYWSVHLSRTGLRAISLPFFLAVAVYWLWRAFEGEGLIHSRPPDKLLPRGDLPHDQAEAGFFKWDAWIMAALAAGLAMYTYFSSRLAPLLWIALLIYALVVRPRLIRLRWRGITAFGILAALIFLPLGLYYLAHPDVFFVRLEQVTTVDAAPTGAGESILDSIRATALMFSVHGDYIWKYNLSGRPVFGPIEAVIFFAGLLACFRYIMRPAYGVLVIWLVIMLLPSALSTDSPSFLRVTAAMPPVALIAALGFVLLGSGLLMLVEHIKDRLPGRDWSQRAAALACLFTLLIGCIDGFGTYRDYIYGWGPSAEAFYNMNADVDHMSRFLAQYPHDSATLAISTLYYHHPTVTFFLHMPESQIKWFDGNQNLIFPAGNKDVIYGFPYQAHLSEQRWQRYFPVKEATRVASEKGPDGSVAYEVYRLPASAQHPANPPSHTLNASIGGTGAEDSEITLLGYDEDVRAEAGNTLHLALYWRVNRKPKDDYTFFSHLVDDQGKTLAQGDINHYPTEEWEPGDLVIGWYDIPVPGKIQPGRYGVQVGLFDRKTYQNVPAIQDGKPSDRVILEPVKIANPNAPQVTVTTPLTNETRIGDFAQLLGYDLPIREIHPGQTITLTLYWRAVARPDRDYTVFAQVLDQAQTSVWGQRDQQPQQGRYPTSIWEPGETISDTYSITIKPDTKPGTYLLQIGMYRLDTQQRLPVTAAGTPVGDRVLLPVQLTIR